jgi:hypothetical protein
MDCLRIYSLYELAHNRMLQGPCWVFQRSSCHNSQLNRILYLGGQIMDCLRIYSLYELAHNGMLQGPCWVFQPSSCRNSQLKRILPWRTNHGLPSIEYIPSMSWLISECCRDRAGFFQPSSCHNSERNRTSPRRQIMDCLRIYSL